tara:strand:+ start:4157 stop:4747 length:591 start_codon:yes stop_codon:yes gene_type:complete
MKSRQGKVQLILISLGVFLFLITYFYYPYLKKGKIIKDESIEQSANKKKAGDEKTTFENLEYQGIYDLNKPFTVTSEKAYMLNNNPDVVYMDKMLVTLYLDDERIVTIISDKGRYNKANYNCFFEKNVKATDGETKIFSENLDFLATNNFMEIYNNVYLYSPSSNLVADKIDYNFETKFFTVSMFDEKAVQVKVLK